MRTRVANLKSTAKIIALGCASGGNFRSDTGEVACRDVPQMVMYHRGLCPAAARGWQGGIVGEKRNIPSRKNLCTSSSCTGTVP
jgi:hypothetical protein